ncbi:hypothetical protein KC19_VG213800 [Ceratodon purpureus]|uniref:Uncharacterized protein n=1 Tax=Ceratodon purpureus TaxID=3225 RepID=A0A8T0HTM7_CERPU|nr:hypothetical protein KC19_VG213800 [Ceratodon purpureus]
MASILSVFRRCFSALALSPLSVIVFRFVLDQVESGIVFFSFGIRSSICSLREVQGGSLLSRSLGLFSHAACVSSAEFRCYLYCCCDCVELAFAQVSQVSAVVIVEIQSILSLISWLKLFFLCFGLLRCQDLRLRW